MNLKLAKRLRRVAERQFPAGEPKVVYVQERYKSGRPGTIRLSPNCLRSRYLRLKRAVRTGG